VTDDPAALSFENARAELDQVVARLEDGATSLEEALALWERGEALHRRCVELLGLAEQRLRVLRPGGEPTPPPA
jgi:exodeoxyribonuclease VII small subunit